MDPDPLSNLPTVYPVISLIILNAIFVAAEYALISCDPENVKEIDSKKNNNKSASQWLLDNSELCVASIQLAITACSILIGWFGIRYLSPIVNELLSSTNIIFFETLASIDSMSWLLSLCTLVFVHVIFGELVVKAVAASFPEATLRLLANFVKIYTQISYPVSRTVYTLANLLLKPFRLTVGQTDKDLLSIKELKRLFSSAPYSSEIGVEQARMIRGVVGFSETVAREVMTPRTDLTFIEVNSTLSDVAKLVVDSGFSRLPVQGDKVDDVLGVLLAKDIIPFLVEPEDGKQKKFDVRRVMRQAYFIPGTKAIDELLNEFRRRKLHMAIILDEHGGLDGVVTMEDLIEEIVGDIFDEGDELEKDISIAINGDITVDGGVLVADLNEKFSISIPEGEYDTIAGFIFTCLGRMPINGDEIVIDFEDLENVYINRIGIDTGSTDGEPENSQNPDDITEGVKLVVEKVQGHRIESIKLVILNQKDDSIPESDLSK